MEPIQILKYALLGVWLVMLVRIVLMHVKHQYFLFRK